MGPSLSELRTAGTAPTSNISAVSSVCQPAGAYYPETALASPEPNLQASDLCDFPPHIQNFRPLPPRKQPENIFLDLQQLTPNMPESDLHELVTAYDKHLFDSSPARNLSDAEHLLREILEKSPNRRRREFDAGRGTCENGEHTRRHRGFDFFYSYTRPKDSIPLQAGMHATIKRIQRTDTYQCETFEDTNQHTQSRGSGEKLGAHMVLTDGIHDFYLSHLDPASIPTNLSPGSNVTPDTYIGDVGNSGNAPHLCNPATGFHTHSQLDSSGGRGQWADPKWDLIAGLLRQLGPERFAQIYNEMQQRNAQPKGTPV